MSPTYLPPIEIKERPILGPRPTCGSYAFQFTGYNIQTYFITLKKLNRPILNCQIGLSGCNKEEKLPPN